MREIKFRAFHKESGKMLTVTAIDWESKSDRYGKYGFVAFKEGIEVLQDYIDVGVGEGLPRYEKEYSCDLDEVELMQFTGLLDKNGKEIYEKDCIDTYLVKNQFITGELITKDGEPGRMIVKDLCVFHFYLCQLMESNKFKSIKDFEKELEVVGNLYEGVK